MFYVAPSLAFVLILHNTENNYWSVSFFNYVEKNCKLLVAIVWGKILAHLSSGIWNHFEELFVFCVQGWKQIAGNCEIIKLCFNCPVFSFLFISGCPSALWPLRFNVCLLNNPCENKESDISVYLGWNSFIPVVQVIFLRIFSFGMDVSFFSSQLGFVFFFSL